ncbi:MAG: ribonucleotide reductase N-terminal alpha domain-containing protein, partial [Alphaproteobacteria bacterium]
MTTNKAIKHTTILINNDTNKNDSKSNFKINIDVKKDERLSNFGKAVLKDRYLMPNENYQELFARVASYYSDDQEHANRIYNYISNVWYMPATPVLSNGGTERGLPISCFLNESTDSLSGIVDLWNENVLLASRGGGIGSFWGNLRSIGETVRGNGKTSGIIPFIKVMDSQTLAISQGSLRRGSAAVYLPVNHPEIEEFIDLRRPTGGDPNRRSLNLHHGVVVTDEFMKAVEKDGDFELKSPHSGQTLEVVKARALWIKLLTARIETGEPYILFI